ncbi:MAG: hypothetical protein P4L61_02760, partial [Candidatus Pacebacteria bacterium]|nr:hypothetical protein [Candidatus Paceibacterota bacterium]
MAVSHVVLDAAGWQQVEDYLRKDQAQTRVSDHLIRHLHELGAESALFEDGFLNRDFTEAYSYYYAKNFRRHSKLCSRLLFFSEKLDFLLDPTRSPQENAETLQLVGETAFLGYVVLRPITRAPLNEAVLKAPPP